MRGKPSSIRYAANRSQTGSKQAAKPTVKLNGQTIASAPERIRTK